MKKHNLTGTKLYNLWKLIKQRCYCKTYPQYKDWGGRGIIVCDEWKTDAKKFIEWSIKNGYKEGLSIDRIDNDGNYEPSNCRFISKKEQNRNKRNNHFVTFKNETHCIAEWEDILGMKSGTIKSRLRRGMSLEKALTSYKYKKDNR